MKINAAIFQKHQQILIICILSIVALLYGPYHYRDEKKETQQEEYHELQAIAKLKSEQLVQWHKERLSEANFFSGGQPYKQFIKDITEGKKEEEVLLRNSLQKIMNNNRYENIFLLDEKGKLLFSVLPDSGLIDSTTKVHSGEIFRLKNIMVQDFYYCKFHKKAQYEILAPVTDGQKIIAALVFMIDPADYLYPLIQEWPTPSKSGEAVIVRQEGNKAVYISQLRYADNTRLQFSFSLDQKEKSGVRAVLGQTGLFEGPDYAGHSVVGDLSKVPDTPWYLIVKEDAKEVYAGFYRNFILVAIITFLAIFYVGATVAWMYHRRQRNLYRKLLHNSTTLHQTQEEFSATLYSIGDGVITTDKEGLVKHLNPMAESLTGWSEQDAKNKPIEDVFHIINENTCEKVESPVTKVLRDGKIVGLANHTLLLSKDGKEIPIDDSGAPIKDKEGNLLGVVMVFSDQTESRLRRKLLDIRLNLFEFAIHHTLKETLTQMLDEIGRFTQSPIGFIHFVLDDQETLHSQCWSTLTKNKFCHTEGTKTHYNISEAGVWADCVRLRKPVVHNDYENLPGKKGLPEGHAGVTREMVVPVFRNQKIVAILGIGNKAANYTDLDVETVTFLADIGWELAEQKIKQELLIQSEERFARLFERAPLGYQSLDENGNFIEINEAWALTLGYRKEEVIGKWFGDFLQPDYVEHFRERFPLFKQAGKIHSEFKMTHRDGLPRDIAFDGRIGYKNDGSFEKTHCILKDVTERRLMEERLRESEEKMRSIFRVSRTGIGVISDRKFMEVNPSFCEMTGYSKEELIGQETRLLYAAQEQCDLVGEAIYCQITQKGFGSVETSWQKKDGSVINVILSETVIDSNSNSTGFTFNALDITERKIAEMAIKEKERQLSSMVSNLPGFIYRCRNDENWTMLYISQGCLNVTGYHPEDFINNSKIAFNDIIAVEYWDVIRKKWEKAVAEKDFFEHEYQILTAGKEVRWVLERGIVVFDKDNKILFLEGYIEDISERKKAEIELREKMDELEKFNRLMVGRENKMIELKLEINELLSRMNLPHKYNPPQINKFLL